ncbi:MAG TPA: hypothetical protein VFC46_12940 [Humisphaera sp.]|nr:hypothetical protein [Humisphaera sp.]
MRLHWLSITLIACGPMLFAADVSNPPSTAPAVSVKLPLPLISLHLKDAPVRQAFERFAEQDRAILQIDPAGADDFWARHKNQRVTVDIDQLPYWQALHELCVASGVTTDDSAPGVLSVRDAGAVKDKPLQLIHGLLHMDASGVQEASVILLGSHPRTNRSCHIWFEVNAAPGLAALRCDALDLLEVTDPDGKPIELARKWQPVFPFSQNRWQLQLDLSPSPDTRAIGKIKGVLSIALAGTSSAVEVDNILKADKVERQLGSLHFVVTTKPAEGGCDVQVVYRDDRNDEALWQKSRRDVASTRPKLFDAQGREFMWAGGSGHGMGGFALYADHRFRRLARKGAKDLPGEPARFVWEIATAGRTIKLPFEFKDLPLH